jgi:hypothetical protein
MKLPINLAATQPTTDALRLVEMVRDGNHSRLDEFLWRIERDDLELLAVMLAAMLPGDVHPPTALRWARTPAWDWPMDVLVTECRRFDDGDRDATALAAARQVEALADASAGRHREWLESRRAAVTNDPNRLRGVA